MRYVQTKRLCVIIIATWRVASGHLLQKASLFVHLYCKMVGVVATAGRIEREKDLSSFTLLGGNKAVHLSAQFHDGIFHFRNLVHDGLRVETIRGLVVFAER